MRIIHLEASKGWGGQEIRILQEAEAMRERGHTVIFGVAPGGCLVARARAAGFEVYEISFIYRSWLFTFFRLLLLFCKHKIEIVNTHSSLDAWIGGISARIGGRKIVRTRHLSTPIRFGWNSRTLYRTLADFVVTTCQAVIEPLSQQSGQPLDRFRSIATGVNPDKMESSPNKIQQFRQKIGAEGKLLVGTVCFLRSWKGIEEFLQAAARLREEKEVRFVIVGGGQLERYQKMAKQMDLDEIVHFTGHLESPFNAIAALDIFVLLSTANEGVSQAILQAAFLKKPLIATPTGGLREVCLDQKTGILVSPFCSKEVADAVRIMHYNPHVREKWGQAAHELVLENFTFKQTIDGMEQVYLKVGSQS
jgi:glycosyltransferase involved in cell wall biosynthesis